MSELLIWFENLRRGDVARVGGKNASLGEMISTLGAKNIRVPQGFATTADAYRGFITANGLERVIAERIDALEAGRTTLREAGLAIRTAITSGEWPKETADAIRAAYRELTTRSGRTKPAVAVRSSATAEDLPEASFAGQQETFLNVTGEAALLDACRRCYASLFTDRAITYRQIHGFGQTEIALSVGVQMMVRSDIGSSGVMFSIDTESGCDRFVLINGAWGLGENVVQGAVDPDEFQVFKPFLDDPGRLPVVARRLGAKEIKMIHGRAGEAATRNVPTSLAERERFTLSDAEVVELARYAKTIEAHYGVAMDMEWAKDGETGELFIVQARPETVQSRKTGAVFQSFEVTPAGRLMVDGLSVGSAAAAGRVCLIRSADEIDRFVDGSVLVTSTTDPDWVPVMKRAAAIVTDHGGRTSHAAIVSRELGLPAVVGTGNATHVLHDGQDVTVSCAEGGTGVVYDGLGHIDVRDISLDDVPETRTGVMLNIANPSAAVRWWRLPADGVGLARMEFLVSNEIKVHPLALLNPERVTDATERSAIAELTKGYKDGRSYFTECLAMGLARIAAVWHPKPVIVRLSDFKSNEYADLLGGRHFEPLEENPMIGLRGAARYYSEFYRDAFALECVALKRLRDDMGFTNVIVMVPFCRSPEEADKVLEVMTANGLTRGENGLEVYVMTEIPSNVIRAAEFAERFDGFSIGSNDLTQLTLGVDRDSEALAEVFRERDPAVIWMIETAIRRAREAGRKIGLCGQAPSNDPDFARLLVKAGIDTISVTPDSFLEVKRNVALAEEGDVRMRRA
ncbi:phosphoenolpyruvate synthase [Celeribacter indicus]|uniref:Phosphoenolpyruvate synthase n=1 Tax=Celeribacter indicus TaxID=1208324 RepID=A0A0B5DNP5_9RHOB|nr:phosphoenolpyruvate synthase [Celeribacter indicus]AJE45183.1 phosphoenolpyruvate synthase [Celeribacter indicus]SDX59255.1 phosphoenolpyruvate synthase [Celeribacter indicus]